MGDAQKRLEKSGEKVLFDAAAIGLRIGRVDRANLEGSAPVPCQRCGHPGPLTGELRPDLVDLRAFGLLVRATIAAAFQQGMERKDGKVWAAWQDILEDEISARPVTRGQAEWLAKHVNGDEVKTPAPMAQWRESVGEYLAALALAPQIEQNGAPDKASTGEALPA